MVFVILALTLTTLLLILLEDGVMPIGPVIPILNVLSLATSSKLILRVLLRGKAKKQLIVVLSSTKAEYIVAATAVKELLRLQAILSELQ